MIQMNKEIMDLAQDQESCNSVLGMMLSSAECLSSIFGIKKFDRLFDCYNNFESGDIKNEEFLKLKLRIQTKLFRINYFYMKEKKGKYNFPDNFDKYNIIRIINIWKQNVSDDKKIYYDNIIDIICDKNTEVKYPRQSIDKINNSGLNENVFVNAMLPIMSPVDQGLQNVGREAELKWNINNNLKLGKKIDDRSKNLEVLIISKLINCLQLGECYYVLNSRDNNYRVNFLNKEQYQIQNYFYIKKKFKDNIIELEKLIKCYYDNYGDSDKIIQTINEYIHCAGVWKKNDNDQLFKEFYNLLIFANDIN